MKTKSIILSVVTALIGIAFVAPEAGAQPPSKTLGGYFFKKQKEYRLQEARSESTVLGKTIGLAVGEEKRKHQPFFLRKHGGTVYIRDYAGGSLLDLPEKTVGLAIRDKSESSAPSPYFHRKHGGRAGTYSYAR